MRCSLPLLGLLLVVPPPGAGRPLAPPLPPVSTMTLPETLSSTATWIPSTLDTSTTTTTVLLSSTPPSTTQPPLTIPSTTIPPTATTSTTTTSTNIPPTATTSATIPSTTVPPTAKTSTTMIPSTTTPSKTPLQLFTTPSSEKTSSSILPSRKPPPSTTTQTSDMVAPTNFTNSSSTVGERSSLTWSTTATFVTRTRPSTTTTPAFQLQTGFSEASYVDRLLRSTAAAVLDIVTPDEELYPAVSDENDDGNSSRWNCTNDYCISDEEYLDLMREYIFPTTSEWVFISLHGVVFVVGLVGNALVCVAVYRNQSMRTVTNYFIVNLAVADFLVILLCLPPTVLWDVTETWFMGTALCKIVLYFQTVSVTVSVLTLTFISIDRWYAICLPLKFKSTVSRAKKAILLIWVLALLFDMPELVVLETAQKALTLDTVFFTQCLPSWGNVSETTFHIVKTLFLYVFPLMFITVAYCHIVKVLWSKNNIPGHSETSKFCADTCNGNGTSSRRGMSRSVSANQSSAAQILSRRKAAKMLVAVDVMFLVCYLPVHAYSLLRYTIDIPQTEATTTFAMLSHWLCYANSAINPVIYNFMSGKFRQEFRRAFNECACVSWAGAGPVHPEDRAVSQGGTGSAQAKRHAVMGGVNGKHNVHVSLTRELDLEMTELTRPGSRARDRERRRIASYRDHI